MNIARNLFRFFIYSNVFIALCAVLMFYQTYRLLLHSCPGINFTGFVFFSTICSYSFHWYLTPPDLDTFSARMTWLRKYRPVHAVLFFIGLAGVVFFGIFLADHWQWFLPAVFATFLYSAPKIRHPYFRALRKVAFGKTIFLAFVWMYVTTILPLVTSGRPWETAFSLFAASRFFFIYAICILFDYRDREYDRTLGIRSLITWLSEKGITNLFMFSLLAFALFTVWMVKYALSFPVMILLLIPGAVTASIYNYAKRNFSDYLYYVVLDGLMALSALLILIFGL